MFELSLEQAERPAVAAGAFSRAVRAGAPLLLAAALFGLNNLAVLSGWLNPPAGHAPALISRAEDVAQYMTWFNALQDRWVIGNYHAPWQTEPALFNFVLPLLARACRLLGLGPVAGYHLLHFLFYVIAAYALRFALAVFTTTTAQAWAACGVILCSVPLQSLAILPVRLWTRRRGWGLPGLDDFVWWSSDGFLHGVSGSLMVTIGTALTLLAFSLLAAYLKTGRRAYFAGALSVIFLSALSHPFEVFVIAGASALTLLWAGGKEWRPRLKEIAAVGVASLLGLLPYLMLSLRHQWLRDAAKLNRWYPPSPLPLLIMLGLPTILALAFLIARPRLSKATDALLCGWFVCTLVGIYVPWVPWSQHLLDGFHYGAGLLLVRLASQHQVAARLWGSHARKLKLLVLAWCVLSLGVYVATYSQSFKEGPDPRPNRLFSTVVREDELAVISWMRQNARPDQLVLAPAQDAAWLATVPMHSLASHSLFSITFEEQRRRADQFYQGAIAPDSARQMLADYGVRYVIAPEQSPALRYLNETEKRAKLGTLLVYELPGNAMKPYPGLPRKGAPAFGAD